MGEITNTDFYSQQQLEQQRLQQQKLAEQQAKKAQEEAGERAEEAKNQENIFDSANKKKNSVSESDNNKAKTLKYYKNKQVLDELQNAHNEVKIAYNDEISEEEDSSSAKLNLDEYANEAAEARNSAETTGNENAFNNVIEKITNKIVKTSKFTGKIKDENGNYTEEFKSHIKKFAEANKEIFSVYNEFKDGNFSLQDKDGNYETAEILKSLANMACDGLATDDILEVPKYKKEKSDTGKSDSKSSIAEFKIDITKINKATAGNSDTDSGTANSDTDKTNKGSSNAEVVADEPKQAKTDTKKTDETDKVNVSEERPEWDDGKLSFEEGAEAVIDGAVNEVKSQLKNIWNGAKSLIGKCAKTVKEHPIECGVAAVAAVGIGILAAPAIAAAAPYVGAVLGAVGVITGAIGIGKAVAAGVKAGKAYKNAQTDEEAREALKGVGSAATHGIENVALTAMSGAQVVNSIKEIKAAGTAAKVVANQLDDAAKAGANQLDDVAKSVAGQADDVAKGVAGEADDVGEYVIFGESSSGAKAAANQLDDTARATGQADDVARAAGNQADDLANIVADKGKGHIFKDETGQWMEEVYQNGEFMGTRPIEDPMKGIDTSKYMRGSSNFDDAAKAGANQLDDTARAAGQADDVARAGGKAANSKIAAIKQKLRAKYKNGNMSEEEWKSLCSNKYDEIRGVGRYRKKYKGGDFNSSIKDLQRKIMSPKSGVEYNTKNGWNYRAAKNRWISGDDIIDRMSLNVKGDTGLIDELDTLMTKGTYVDKYGKTVSIGDPGQFYYKTYDNATKWGLREDPVTIYCRGKASPKLEEALKQISQKYARGALYGAENTATPWYAKEISPSADMIKKLYNAALKYNKNLAKCIYDTATKNGTREPILSAGWYKSFSNILSDFASCLQYA